MYSFSIDPSLALLQRACLVWGGFATARAGACDLLGAPFTAAFRSLCTLGLDGGRLSSNAFI